MDTGRVWGKRIQRLIFCLGKHVTKLPEVVQRIHILRINPKGLSELLVGREVSGLREICLGEYDPRGSRSRVRLESPFCQTRGLRKFALVQGLGAFGEFGSE